LDFNFLTWIIFLPVVGAILIAFIPGLTSRKIKSLAATFTFVPLALSIYVFSIFDRSLAAAGVVQFQFEEFEIVRQVGLADQVRVHPDESAFFAVGHAGADADDGTEHPPKTTQTIQEMKELISRYSTCIVAMIGSMESVLIFKLSQANRSRGGILGSPPYPISRARQKISAR